MITDIEMNGTLRGAVEEYNLCRNLRQDDFLNAECFRTFKTQDMNAQQWLQRLEVEMKKISEMRAFVYVPPTRRPTIRTKRTKAPQVDIYGFRNLDSPFALLSPFEFTMNWEAEPLTYWDDRTAWTDMGKRELALHGQERDKMILRPGVHFKVIEPMNTSYYTFPKEPVHIYDTLRNSWVIVRRNRPIVPVLEGVPLPSPAKPAEENAKYFSVFFRPWTLLHAQTDIPHMANLAVIAYEPERVCKEKTLLCDLMRDERLPKTTERVLSKPHKSSYNFSRAWDAYIRGNVGSRHAARIITSVITNTLARTTEEHDNPDGADASDIDDDIPPLRWEAKDLRTLLRAVGEEDSMTQDRTESADNAMERN